jgi:dipeptidyl aminopeptidase/acylaminoacyl peptidase
MSSSPTITAKLTLVRGARRGAALVAVPLLGLAWAPFAATAAATVPSGFIAVTTGSGSLQISQFTLDGVLVRRLTTGPANHNYPSLSRDGTQLLYTGDEGGMQEIYRRNLVAGGPAIQLTRPPMIATSPGWSPDGDSIAYSAVVPGAAAYQIFVAHADGSRPVQLTHTNDSGNTQPVFSPDGSHIAYINGRETTTPGAGGSSITLLANRIWVVDADGSSAAPLTPGPRDAYPQWFDPTTVFFAREDVATQTSRIVSVGLDGREQNQSPLDQHFLEPRPLPDGKTYGATVEDGAALHLVRVSRTDGAALTASAASDFVVEPLRVPAAEGSAFTLAWIVSASPPASSATGPLIVVVVLGLAGLLVFAGLGLLAQRKTNAC